MQKGKLIKNKKGELIGWVIQATVKTLLTKNRTFVAVVPQEAHGLKRDRFKTLKDARVWIHQEYNGLILGER